MSGNTRKYIRVVLVLALVISSAMMIQKYTQYSNADRSSELAVDLAQGEEMIDLEDEAVPLAGLPESPWSEEPLAENVQFLADLDLDALKEVNQEVLGWIHVPDTELSYPLLQTDNNDTYLNKSWDGKKNSAGSIFLETKNPSDFSAFNTIIYGHRMTNNSMFGTLRHYTTQEYLAEHPYIYIASEEEVRRYEIFSAYEAPVTSPTYWLNIEKEAHITKALEHFIGSSVIQGAVTPTKEDQVITLSTCTGTGTYHSRWVVQAMLVDRWQR